MAYWDSFMDAARRRGRPRLLQLDSEGYEFEAVVMVRARKPGKPDKWLSYRTFEGENHNIDVTAFLVEARSVFLQHPYDTAKRRKEPEWVIHEPGPEH